MLIKIKHFLFIAFEVSGSDNKAVLFKLPNFGLCFRSKNSFRSLKNQIYLLLVK